MHLRTGVRARARARARTRVQVAGSRARVYTLLTDSLTLDRGPRVWSHMIQAAPSGVRISSNQSESLTLTVDH